MVAMEGFLVFFRGYVTGGEQRVMLVRMSVHLPEANGWFTHGEPDSSVTLCCSGQLLSVRIRLLRLM
jgi:hypothetical protein